jgi:DNA-binding GntR family transcriptional regulator
MVPSPGSPTEVKKSAVDRAVEGIRERLKAGYYAPGQRLVEADLMSELSVGRNAVREALARLGSEGLISSEPHRGASVRRLDLDELSEFFIVREALEGMAARLAAGKIDERPNRSIMEGALDSIRRASKAGDPYLYMDENLNFHAAIVSLARNDRLSEFVSRLHLQLFRIQFRPNATMLSHSHPEHEEIAAAVLAGDEDRAEATMRNHLRLRSVETLQTIADQFRPPVS